MEEEEDIEAAVIKVYTDVARQQAKEISVGKDHCRMIGYDTSSLPDEAWTAA